MAKRPVNYEQTDPRWAKFLYDVNLKNGPDYMSGTGCGPTTAAMIVATYIDPKITPLEMAKWAMAKGYRTPDNGTAWALFAGVAKEYGLTFLQTSSHSSALSCIKDGGLVVCIMGPGRWTKGGHYILWYAWDGAYVYINDPAVPAGAREKAKLTELQQDVRAYFCFWPPVWPALQKLNRLGIINSPDYWMKHWDDLQWLDKLIIQGAAKAVKAGTPYMDIEQALIRLTERGVISAPDYWKQNYRKVLYLDGLIRNLAAAV